MGIFDRLIWQPDRMLLDDLVFRLQHCRADDWDLGKDCFVFYKIRKLVDQYDRFWQSRPQSSVDHVFELGIWDGGSIAFWFELLQPKIHVGIDKQQRDDSEYFLRYRDSRDRGNRIKTYWGVDQGNSDTLRGIVQQDFSGPLDLVIDDASHMYGLTRSSFETLFPFLRPGGLYIIEDWAWAYWPEFDELWADRTPLTQLVFELVEATGSSTELISSLVVYEGFAVVERGPLSLDSAGGFSLEDHITRRAATSRLAKLIGRAWPVRRGQ